MSRKISIFFIALLLALIPSCMFDLIEQNETLNFSCRVGSELSGSTVSVDIYNNGRLLENKKQVVAENTEIVNFVFENLVQKSEIEIVAKVIKDGVEYFSGRTTYVVKSDSNNVELALKVASVPLKVSTYKFNFSGIEGSNLSIYINNKLFKTTNLGDCKTPVVEDLGHVMVGSEIKCQVVKHDDKLGKDVVLLNNEADIYKVGENSRSVFPNMSVINTKTTLVTLLPDKSEIDLTGAHLYYTINGETLPVYNIKNTDTKLQADLGYVETGKELKIEIIVKTEDESVKLFAGSYNGRAQGLNQEIPISLGAKYKKLAVSLDPDFMMTNGNELNGKTFEVQAGGKTYSPITIENGVAVVYMDDPMEIGTSLTYTASVKSGSNIIFQSSGTYAVTENSTNIAVIPERKMAPVKITTEGFTSDTVGSKLEIIVNNNLVNTVNIEAAPSEIDLGYLEPGSVIKCSVVKNKGTAEEIVLYSSDKKPHTVAAGDSVIKPDLAIINTKTTVKVTLPLKSEIDLTGAKIYYTVTGKTIPEHTILKTEETVTSDIGYVQTGSQINVSVVVKSADGLKVLGNGSFTGTVSGSKFEIPVSLSAKYKIVSFSPAAEFMTANSTELDGKDFEIIVGSKTYSAVTITNQTATVSIDPVEIGTTITYTASIKSGTDIIFQAKDCTFKVTSEDTTVSVTPERKMASITIKNTALTDTPAGTDSSKLSIKFGGTLKYEPALSDNGSGGLEASYGPVYVALDTVISADITNADYGLVYKTSADAAHTVVAGDNGQTIALNLDPNKVSITVKADVLKTAVVGANFIVTQAGSADPLYSNAIDTSGTKEQLPVSTTPVSVIVGKEFTVSVKKTDTTKQLVYEGTAVVKASDTEAVVTLAQKFVSVSMDTIKFGYLSSPQLKVTVGGVEVGTYNLDGNKPFNGKYVIPIGYYASGTSLNIKAEIINTRNVRKDIADPAAGAKKASKADVLYKYEGKKTVASDSNNINLTLTKTSGYVLWGSVKGERRSEIRYKVCYDDISSLTSIAYNKDDEGNLNSDEYLVEGASGIYQSPINDFAFNSEGGIAVLSKSPPGGENFTGITETVYQGSDVIIDNGNLDTESCLRLETAGYGVCIAPYKNDMLIAYADNSMLIKRKNDDTTESVTFTLPGNTGLTSPSIIEMAVKENDIYVAIQNRDDYGILSGLAVYKGTIGSGGTSITNLTAIYTNANAATDFASATSYSITDMIISGSNLYALVVDTSNAPSSGQRSRGGILIIPTSGIGGSGGSGESVTVGPVFCMQTDTSTGFMTKSGSDKNDNFVGPRKFISNRTDKFIIADSGALINTSDSKEFCKRIIVFDPNTNTIEKTIPVNNDTDSYAFEGEIKRTSNENYYVNSN